jgi:protein SCO1/2
MREGRRSFMGQRVRVVMLVLVLLLAPGGAPLLPGSGRAGAAPPKGKAVAEVEVDVHDLELLDQDGTKLRFKSEVIADLVVVIDTFYTDCGLICPILSAIFAELQKRLGDRLCEDVTLVSLSVDPVTDIPPRLKEYAATWKARPGWVFLTGKEPNMTRVLDGLGLYAPDFTAHPAAFLVGDGKTGRWTRYFGFPSPQKLLAKVDELIATRP